MARSLNTKPLHAGFATEVEDPILELVDDPDAIEQLKLLWQRSPVLVFRRQALEESELVRFSGRFGQCESAARKDIQSPYHEEIIYFSTLKYADGRFVGGFAGGEDVDWHSDQTFRLRPATGAILWGLEVPRDGGDIYWADQYAAWERLPADVRQLIEGRTGTFRYAKRYARLNPLELKGKAQDLLNLPDPHHPLVLMHPRTGRKALYADPTTLVAIDGLPPADSERVLPILFEAAGHPAHAYRHKVQCGDLMMWDNGCTLHRRDEMRLDQPRLMKRTTFRLPASGHCVPTA
jgi:taurine dioxygenase